MLTVTTNNMFYVVVLQFGSQSMQVYQKRAVYLAIIWCLPLVVVGTTAVWRGEDYAKDKL